MRHAILCTVFLLGSGFAAPAGWLPGFHQHGVFHEITDIERAGKYLYVAGSFESIGPVPATHVARLGPDGWEAMGNIPCTVVSQLEVLEGGPVYAACGPNIYTWNGTAWNPLQLPSEGTTVPRDIMAMALGAQGLFYTRGNSPEVWRIRGDTAMAMGAGIKGYISCMEFLGDDLAIGGWFSAVGDQQTSNIARLSSGSWRTYGEGVPEPVKAMKVFGGAVYAGTEMGVMRWDSAGWSPLDIGVTGEHTVYALEAGDSVLYAGVYPAQEGKALARLQAGTWSLHGADFLKGKAEIYALALFQGSLWFGGRIVNPSDPGIEHLGSWDGVTFRTPVPSGRAPAGRVRSLASDGRGGLFVAGSLNKPDGREGFSLVARRTDSGWEETGPYLSGEIYSVDKPRLVAYGQGGLYLAGVGVAGGTVNASGVQHFDGQAWKPLTGALTGASLLALQPFSGGVYVGGDFMELDTAPARMVARWDGQGWAGLGTGANGAVRALALSGDDLLAAGDFTAIGGLPARVGRWSGGRWTRLDELAGTDGLENGSVHALEIWDGMVVAGGDFNVAGGLLAGGVAAWDGARWKVFGKGLQGTVLALEVCQGNLYAGGQFTFTATGTRVNGIARWSGTAWEPLGAGLSNRRDETGTPLAGVVRQLLAMGPELWVSGDFLSAGDLVSTHLAVWSTGDPAQSIRDRDRVSARESPPGRFLDLAGMSERKTPAGMRIFDLGGRRIAGRPAGSGWRVLGR